MYVSLCRGIPESSFRKPPKPPQPQTHRLNLGGGGGPPRRKTSGYARPQFAGPMELETLMEEGAATGSGDVRAADDGTRTPLTNGDKSAPAQTTKRLLDDDRQLQPQRSGATTMKSPSNSSERPRSTINLYLAACTVNMGALAAGCALTWSSPTLVKLESGDPSIGMGAIDKDNISWVSSLVTLGAAIGPLLAGALLDRLGRKNTILLSMILSTISWIMIAFVPNLYALFVARVLAGIVVGVIFTAVPMYIAEIAELRLRSSLGTLMQFFLCAGFLIEYIVGPYTSYFTLAIVSLATPVLCFGMFVWMPDSPHSLLLLPKKGEQDALKSLRWLRGNPQETTLLKELDEIKKSVDDSKKQKSGFGELFANAGNVRAVCISCAMVAWQQLSGINVVLMYSEEIFRKTGVDMSASLSTIVVGTVMLGAAGVTPSLAKITTMRKLLYVSAIGMAITDGALGIFFYMQKSGDVSSIGWLPVTSLVLFIITYCLGFGPLPWAIMGEIFPTNLKSVASALTASFCWMLGFLLTKAFSAVSDAIGIHNVFWLFAGCCILALLFAAFLLPETEGKSMQEIQDILHRRTKPGQDYKMTRA